MNHLKGNEDGIAKYHCYLAISPNEHMPTSYHSKDRSDQSKWIHGSGVELSQVINSPYVECVLCLNPMATAKKKEKKEKKKKKATIFQEF